MQDAIAKAMLKRGKPKSPASPSIWVAVPAVEQERQLATSFLVGMQTGAIVAHVETAPAPRIGILRTVKLLALGVSALLAVAGASLASGYEVGYSAVQTRWIELEETPLGVQQMNRKVVPVGKAGTYDHIKGKMQ